MNGSVATSGRENGELVEGRKFDTKSRKDGRVVSDESGVVSPQREYLSSFSLQEAA